MWYEYMHSRRCHVNHYTNCDKVRRALNIQLRLNFGQHLEDKGRTVRVYSWTDVAAIQGNKL